MNETRNRELQVLERYVRRLLHDSDEMYRSWLDKAYAGSRRAPEMEAGAASGLLRRFADAFRSGAQGADMDCDTAQALAVAIDTLLASPSAVREAAAKVAWNSRREHVISYIGTEIETVPGFTGDPVKALAIAARIYDNLAVALSPNDLAPIQPTEGTGWRPIDEERSRSKAPWDGKPVLLWKERTKEQYIAAWVYGDHPGWCTPDGFEIFGATKWQPLPASPEDKPGAGE